MGTLLKATTLKKVRSRLAKDIRKNGGVDFGLSFKLAKAYLRGDVDTWCALGGKYELNPNFPDDWVYDWSYGNWNEYY